MEQLKHKTDMGKVREFLAGKYDVIVIGAGHAGCEAALACARLNMSTMMMTMSLDSIAMLACNPSIGGTGKGQLVKEIDALGGQMGINADKTLIQSRMLNTAKGPAVHSLRGQADKYRYHTEMKRTLEDEPNIDIVMDEVVALYYMAKDPETYRVLEEGLANEHYVIGFRKGDEALKNEIEKYLKEMKEDGTLAQICTTWFGKDVNTIQ